MVNIANNSTPNFLILTRSAQTYLEKTETDSNMYGTTEREREREREYLVVSKLYKGCEITIAIVV